MAKKRFVIFKDQISSFCRKGCGSKVIGAKGSIILVEVEVSKDDMIDRNTMATEDIINEPGEC